MGTWIRGLEWVVLMDMRRSKGWHAPMKLHVSEGVGWRMNERKMGVMKDA